MDREPAFDALRPKLAAGALIPSRVFDDPLAWPRQGQGWRAVDFEGYRKDASYRIGVRPHAPEPREAGQYRGELRLDRLAGGRFEWTVREELAVGKVAPSQLAAALDALLRGAEATDEARARAAVRAAFPRASAKLGELLRLERLGLARDPAGATRIELAVRVTPEGLRPGRPRFAAFVDQYFGPIRGRAEARDATGAAFWSFEVERHLWTLRLRVKGGSLVPLEGDDDRRVPARLAVTGDYATKMGRFGVAVKRLEADVDLTRGPTEKGFLAHFRRQPDWDLPFLVEPLLGAPLHYPFEGPGSEAGWAAVETGAGTSLVRRYRVRLAENWILRWLGGMTNRAVSAFRAGAEDEAESYYGECLLAVRDDLADLLAVP